MNQSSKSRWPVAVLGVLALVVSYRSTATAGTDTWTIGGPTVGAVYDLKVDRQNSNVIYATIFNQSAIFKSNDYGEQWSRFSNGFKTDEAIHSIAVDSHSSSILYAVGFNTVYKSLNGGVDWTSVFSLPGGMGNTFGSKHSISVSTRDSGIVTILSETGIYRSDDAGASWEHVLPAGLIYEYHRRLFVGASPQEIYTLAGYRSIDEGITWQAFPLPSFPLSLAFDPTNENILYMGTGSSGILRSLDGGDTWLPMYTGNLPTTGNINDIVFHPTNPDIIFVAYSGDTGSGVYRSLDHGKTWAQMNDGLGIRNVWRLVVDDGSLTHLHAGTSVGVYDYTVTTLQPANYSVTINDGVVYCNSEAVTLTLTAPPNTTGMQISNDGSFSGIQWESFVATRPWTLAGYGDSIVTRVVYARFQNSTGTTSSPYMDDVILDTVPPTGTVVYTPTTTLGSPTHSPLSYASDVLTHSVYLPVIGKRFRPGFELVELGLVASDDLSGVSSALVSNDDPTFSEAAEVPYSSLAEWWVPSQADPVTVYVKFVDRAGNHSIPCSVSIEP